MAIDYREEVKPVVKEGTKVVSGDDYAKSDMGKWLNAEAFDTTFIDFKLNAYQANLLKGYHNSFSPGDIIEINFATGPVKIEGETEEEKRIRLARQKMAALAFVNEQRRALGLDHLDNLREGKAANAEECVISASVMFGDPTVYAKTGAMNAEYGRYRAAGVIMREEVPVVRVRPPDEVAHFIRDFDAGLYPELG